MNILGIMLLLPAIAEGIAPSLLCMALLTAPPAASQRLRALLDAGLLADLVQVSSHGFSGRIVSDRNGNLSRDREWWGHQVETLSEKDFQRLYKVGRERFCWLEDLIRDDVEPDAIGKYMAIVSSGSYINSRTMLAVTLRFLAGSNVHDICMIHGVSDSAFYPAVWKVIDALDRHLEVDNIDPNDIVALDKLSEAMHHRSKGTIQGCIGALDGMAVKIGRPKATCSTTPSYYFNRKGFYSVNLQAIADANRKFLWYSMATCGGTHDSLAWKVTKLAMDLAATPLPYGMFIAGDDAYACSNQLITPYSTQSCTSEFPERDHFNFYQSRCRINVECAFGMLVIRFGILRRPQIHDLKYVPTVTAVCMKLHNLCIDDGMTSRMPALGCDICEGDSMRPIRQDRCSFSPRDGHKKRQKTDLRKEICDFLASNNHTRPEHSMQKKRARE